MKRTWNEKGFYAKQWYGTEGEIEVTFDLNGKVLTIVDLQPDYDETGTILNPIMLADFRKEVA